MFLFCVVMACPNNSFCMNKTQSLKGDIRAWRKVGWDINQRQEDKFKHFVAAAPEGSYKKLISKIENKKKYIENSLIIRQNCCLEEIKNEFEISDKIWKIIQEVTEKMCAFEKNHQHLLAIQPFVVTMIPEMRDDFYKRLALKTDINPRRISLYDVQGEGKFFVQYPFSSVTYDNGAVIIDESKTKPGAITIDSSVSHFNQIYKPKIHRKYTSSCKVCG